MYRQVIENVKDIIKQKKAPILLILGMRQVGKSTLAKSLCEGLDHTSFNFDLLSDIGEFSQKNRYDLANFAKRYKDRMIIIDEVQKSPEAIGVIKYLYDTFSLRFILTGSSELKIRRGVGDSLAGRLREIKLYPLSLEEIDRQNGLMFDKKKEFNNYDFNQQQLLKYLVYGSLPELQNIEESEYAGYLDGLTNTLLSRDILEISGTRKPVQIYYLAKLLAFQIGQIINFNELAQSTNLSRISIVNFIEIFEQMGLITKVNPISTNKRQSITKRIKIYFNDLGIRNSLVSDYSEFNRRSDKGALLENAVFIGIKRRLEYGGSRYELGFFHSKYGSEIDIVRKVGNKEDLFEVKTNKKYERKKNKVTYITSETAQKYIY